MEGIEPVLVGAGALIFFMMTAAGALIGALVPIGAKPAPPTPPINPRPSERSDPPALQPVVLPADPFPTIVVQQPPLCVDVVHQPAEPAKRREKHGKKHKKGDAGDVVAGLLVLGVLAAIFGGGGKK